MKFFYVPEAVALKPGDTVVLPTGESRHANTVLRLKKDDPIWLLNGVGSRFSARIVQPDLAATVCVVTGVDDEIPMPYRLHIAISPTKTGERLEWFIEKAVEMGVAEVTPVLCEHTERSRVNTDKLQNLIVSACKQSGRAWFPKLNEPVRFSRLIRSDIAGVKLIAHCAGGNKMTLRDYIRQNTEFTVLIGPEGDFTPNEIKDAERAGFEMLSLGALRLRTETAGIYVCAGLSVILPHRYEN